MNHRFFRRGAALLIAVAVGPVFAGAAAVPGVRKCRAIRIGESVPVIDGRLVESAWDNGSWESGFVQRDPYEGREPSEQTSFKILYDDKNVYVGVRAHDSRPDLIEKRLGRRDQAGGDVVLVALDSLHDHLTAYVFSVNAAGVKTDQIVANNGLSSGGEEEDMSWDPIWDAAVSSDDQGWSAEMRIPLSQLRFGAKDEQEWGLQVLRSLFRTNETSEWQLIPRNAPGWVHLFGELEGLAGLAAPHQVEIMPYAVGSLMSSRPVPGNPFATGRDRRLRSGLDGKVGVTSDLTLNLTINPDFGQVEADPSVVNLTAFETFFQEKRPFFVEGRNLFDFRLTSGDGDFSFDNLFYSRRVGRSPQFTPGGPGFVDMPAAATILGAFKLTGKTKSGFSLGLMESVTSRESASVFHDEVYTDVAVEPLTNYFAARVQKDWNSGATVLGGMITAVNREAAGGSFGTLHRAAYSGGIDFSHSWGNRNYYLSFKAVTSHVRGTAEAILATQLSPIRYFQRPDAGYVGVDLRRTSLTGTGGHFEIGKQGGGRWTYAAGVTWRSPELELNDAGYLRQTDMIMAFIWAGYRITEPFGPFRQVNVNFNGWGGFNFGGETIFKGGNVNLNLTLKNEWSVGFGYNPQGSSLSSAALRGGPSLYWPGGNHFWGYVGTDSRRKVQLSFFGNAGRRGPGDMVSWSLSPQLTVIPGSAFQVSLAPSYSRHHNVLQYAGTRTAGEEPRYLFGTIDQETLSLTLRMTYCLTPDLTIQYYGMPFVSAGAYRDFKKIMNSRSPIAGERFLRLGEAAVYDPSARQYRVDENGDGTADYTFGNPDFNVREFRSNLVLRWEYTPGSALYVVWSQGRTGFLPEGSFDYGRDLGGLFDTHPDNVFLIKFSYCFQL